MFHHPDAQAMAEAKAPAGGRRLRHEARDELAAAAVSLVGSLVTTLLVWALLRWLG
jgi:hypothetical protein